MTELTQLDGRPIEARTLRWPTAATLAQCRLIKVLAGDEEGRRRWSAGGFLLTDGGLVLGLGSDRALGSTTLCSIHPPGAERAFRFVANAEEIDERFVKRWGTTMAPLLPWSGASVRWYALRPATLSDLTGHRPGAALQLGA